MLGQHGGPPCTITRHAVFSGLGGLVPYIILSHNRATLTQLLQNFVLSLHNIPPLLFKPVRWLLHRFPTTTPSLTISLRCLGLSAAIAFVKFLVFPSRHVEPCAGRDSVRDGRQSHLDNSGATTTVPPVAANDNVYTSHTNHHNTSTRRTRKRRTRQSRSNQTCENRRAWDGGGSRFSTSTYTNPPLLEVYLQQSVEVPHSDVPLARLCILSGVRFIPGKMHISEFLDF